MFVYQHDDSHVHTCHQPTWNSWWGKILVITRLDKHFALVRWPKIVQSKLPYPAQNPVIQGIPVHSANLLAVYSLAVAGQQILEQMWVGSGYSRGPVS